MPLKPRVWVSGILASAACGCSAGDRLTHPSPPQPQVEERQPVVTSDLTPLLEIMDALPNSDPARQAELFQGAKDGAAAQPTVGNRLRYALALATPGHGGSDPVAARRQLAELLAMPETLQPAERLLAQVELRDVDQRLIMLAENKQLRNEETQESREKLSAANRRLAAESDENTRLRKALDEERAKLEAVTHIERSINERAASTAHTP